MFQATKMREVAEKVQEDNDVKESKLLMNKVITQSNEGETTLNYEGTLSKTTYKLFKRLGYNIEEISENNFKLNW
jgi:hypothetical protein